MKKSNIKLKVFSTTVASILTIVIQPSAIADTLAASDADYTFMITDDWHNCPQLGTAYQEVYAFETASFYVNICQKGNVYFYLGETKESEYSSIFIPADPLENGRGFHATNGNVSYLVLLPFSEENNLQSRTGEPAEAILTIKRNSQLVSVESSFNKYCEESATAIMLNNIELDYQDSSQVAIIPQQQDGSLDIPSINMGNRLLAAEIFKSNSRFDFYQIGGELHRLTTCK